MSDVIPLNARSLTFRWQGRRHTLQFDEEFLSWSFSDPPLFQSGKTALWRIMPELAVDMSDWGQSLPYTRAGGYSLAVGIIVYFSDIRAHVPLLVPGLGLFAVYCFFRSVWKCWPPERTKIVTDYGEVLTVIPHLEHIATQRQAFEQSLLESVRKARQRHYDDA